MADLVETGAHYGYCRWCGGALVATNWGREICGLCYLEGRPAAGEEGFDAS